MWEGVLDIMLATTVIPWHRMIIDPKPVKWDIKVRRSRSISPSLKIAGETVSAQLPTVLAEDEHADEVTIMEATEDIIGIAQRDPDTGEVGTIFFSRSQLKVMAELAGLKILT